MNRKNWSRFRFGDVVENVNERVEPSTAAEEIYVGLDDLDSGSLHIRRWYRGSDVISTKLRFRKGNIILGRRNGGAGEAGRGAAEVPAVEISVGSLSSTINWTTLKHEPFALPFRAASE